MPSLVGPRHCGQLSARAAAALHAIFTTKGKGADNANAAGHLRSRSGGVAELAADGVEGGIGVAAGVPDGYERLKEFTRGRTIDAAMLAAFIDGLPLSAPEKARLRGLRPEGYTGLAAALARRV